MKSPSSSGSNSVLTFKRNNLAEIIELALSEPRRIKAAGKKCSTAILVTDKGFILNIYIFA